MNPVRMSVLHRCTMILLSLFFFHRQVVAQDSNAEPPVGRAKEEQTTLPRYPDMVLPEAVDLLRAKPFDWIVLKSQEVLVVDPVSMRPDPITRVTIKHDIAQQMYNRMLKNRPYKIAEIESVRQYSKNKDQAAEADATETRLKEELENARERADALKPQTFKLPVTLRDGSVDPEYVLDLRLVETVIHFEDLILRRAEQLIADGRIPLAYDLLLLVARRHRDNNLLIQSELETEEQELVRQIKSLDDERAILRTSKVSLTPAVSKNVPGSKGRLAALEKPDKSWFKRVSENASAAALFLGLVLSAGTLRDTFFVKPETDRIARISQFNQAVNSAAKTRQELVEIQQRGGNPEMLAQLSSIITPRVHNDIATARAILRDLELKDVGISQLSIFAGEALAINDLESVKSFLDSALKKTDAPPFLKSEAKFLHSRYLYLTGDKTGGRSAMREGMALRASEPGGASVRTSILMDLVTVGFSFGDCANAEADLREFSAELKTASYPQQQKIDMGQYMKYRLKQVLGTTCPFPGDFDQLLPYDALPPRVPGGVPPMGPPLQTPPMPATRPGR